MFVRGLGKHKVVEVVDVVEVVEVIAGMSSSLLDHFDISIP